METCERCGANLALVGRVHRCVPRETERGTKPQATNNAVGLVPQRNKGGRPSLGAPWKALGVSRRTYFRRRRISA
jgi:hypothetical protein